MAVVGAGTMGQQIGFQCAGHGLDVVLYDIAPAALESARGRIDAYAERLVAGGCDRGRGARFGVGEDHDDDRRFGGGRRTPTC